MARVTRDKDKDPEDRIQNARLAASRRGGRPVDASWDRDALTHVSRLRDVGEWCPPECHRVNGRVAAGWEVELVFAARMRERTRELAIMRGLA